MRKLWLPTGRRTVRKAGFDLDGVLRDTGYTAYETVCRIIDKYGGRKVTYAEYLLKEFSHAEYLQTLGVHLEKDELKREYYGIHPPDYKRGPFPDVDGFCQTLRAMEIELFVVSASRAEWVEGWFEKHGIHAHFVHVKHSAYPKAPHLARLCGELGTAPAEVFYVGDMGHDMVAAREAGVIPIGITRDYNGAESSLLKAGAATVVHHLADLTRLIA